MKIEVAAEVGAGKIYQNTVVVFRRFIQLRWKFRKKKSAHECLSAANCHSAEALPVLRRW